MNNVYTVSAAPHLKERISVRSVMWQVVIALTPAFLAAIYFFGFRALMLTVYTIAAAVITEALIQKLRKQPVTISDGSAVVTGMLLAFNVHAGVPWWLPVIGAVFAIGIGKHIFGGLGHNPFNPALIGRAFMVASWPTLMTTGWITPEPAFKIAAGIKSTINGLTHLPANIPDVITSATPLGVAKTLRDASQISPEMADIVMNRLTSMDTLFQLFWGNIGGCLGEVSAAALLLGAAFLAAKHIIEWRIPLSYIGTVFVLTLLFGGINGFLSASVLLPFFHIFSGGLILGAFFMATDMVTSPVTKRGRIYFGIGCGILTVVIRLAGGYPEGVTYSILLMNIAVPLIDRYTVPKPFGEVKK